MYILINKIKKIVLFLFLLIMILMGPKNRLTFGYSQYKARLLYLIEIHKSRFCALEIRFKIQAQKWIIRHLLEFYLIKFQTVGES